MDNALGDLSAVIERWAGSVSEDPAEVMAQVVAASSEVEGCLDWIEGNIMLEQAALIHSRLSGVLALLGLHFPGSPLLTRLTWRAYEVTTSLRARASRRFNAGMNLFNVGRLVYMQGDYVGGLRQIVCALAEDIYGNPQNLGWVKSSHAYKFLAAHGMDDGIFTTLVASVDKHRSNSATVPWFPEDIGFFEPVVADFLLGAVSQVGFNRAYWSQLVSLAKDADEDAKGPALERLAIYLVSQIDGLRIIGRDVRTETSEWDVLCRFAVAGHPLQGVFGTYVVAECKNLTGPCTSHAVRNFAYKILSVRASGGILIALGGITGQEDQERYAWGEVKRAFRQHGITIVVITQKDMEIAKTKKQLVDLILRRAEDIRFERTGFTVYPHKKAGRIGSSNSGKKPT